MVAYCKFEDLESYFALLIVTLSFFCACSGALPVENQSAPPTQSMAPSSLPGECVDPMALMATKEEAEYGLRRFDEPLDLNNDGSPDLALGVESLCGASFSNCDWYLFAMDGECGYFVGSISGHIEVESSKETHKGLFDIYTSWNMGCGGQARIEKIWRFDGNIYQVNGSRECHCPEVETESEQYAEGLCDPW